MQINITAGNWPSISIRIWRESVNSRWYYQYAITMHRWGCGMRLGCFFTGKTYNHPGFESEKDAAKDLIAIMQQNMVNHANLTTEEKTIFVRVIKTLKEGRKKDELCIVSILSR